MGCARVGRRKNVVFFGFFGGGGSNTIGQRERKETPHASAVFDTYHREGKYTI